MRTKASVFLFLLVATAGGLQAEHYSLYNSGTLAESVENPWVSVFDNAGGVVAAHFFIPTVNGDGFLQGDAAEAGRELLVWDRKRQQPLSEPDAEDDLN